MSTSTSGGTTTSFNNTPQAKDDFYIVGEDQIVIFDVMANDLGGNAKVLWSIDDTAADGSADLIAKDVAGVSEYSELGAKITLTADGKISYDTNALDSLAAGQTATDRFTYAIRLSNGTLSWATVTVTVTGTNDGPTITSAAQSGSATEVADQAVGENVDLHSASGAVTFNDVDLTDTHSASFAAQGAGYLGTFSLAPVNQAGDSVGWSFSVNDAVLDSLAAGQTLTQKYDVRIDDGHGGTAVQTVTITITGTNDGPDIKLLPGDTAYGALTETNAGLSANGTLTVFDADTTDTVNVSVSSVNVGGTGGSGGLTNGQLLAMLSLTGNNANAANGAQGSLGWAFNSGTQAFDYLSAGETLVLTYTLTGNDGHGVTDTQTVTVTVTGSNDDPVLTVDTTGGVTEDATDPTLTDTGALSFTDVDVNDTHMVGSGYNGDASWTGGSLSPAQVAALTAGFSADSDSWDYTLANAAVDFLAAGETITLSFDVTVTDNHGGSDTETVTITVTGSNDDPDIRVSAGDSASASLPETNAGLSTNGTLTVTDVDTSDTISTSISLTSVTGNAGGLTNPQLLAMLSATPNSGLPADAGNTNNLTWNFNSGSQAFNYLTPGQSLQLTYTLTVSDGHGGTDAQDVTVTITGTNDAPLLTGDLAAPINEGGSYQLTTADLNFTDPDDAAAVVTFTATGLSNGTLFVNGVPQNSFTGAQLAAGLVTFTHNGSETLTAGFSITVEDGNEDVSTPVAQPFNFTVAPVNDAPVAVADTANTAEDSSILINVLTNDSDPDGDTLSLTAANVTTGLGTATVESGQVRYDPGTAYNSLAVGETANVVVSYSISDGHGGTATSTATVTVTGTNDVPDIRVQAGDSSSVTIAETNAGLTASDTFTVTDADTSDTVSTGVALTTVSGNQGSLTNAQLLAMLSVVPTSGLPANSGSANNLTWTFNSGTEAFNYLLVGQSLNLTYTLTVSDGHGGTDTQTLTVAVTGTADGITLAPVYTGDDDPNNFDGANAQAAGSNLITGTNGNDSALVAGSNQPNTIRALDGNDTVNAGGGGDTVYGGNGTDTINGEAGDDDLYGQAGDDVIHGDAGNDEIWGGSGNDQIFGDQNDDQILWGGSGTDIIQGGNNDDRLAGGFGADTLTGGTGLDNFIYLDVRDRGDTITDFQVGSDEIDLSAIDANSTIGGNQAFALGGTTATAFGVWYQQVGGNTIVYADTDGDVTTAELWMTLTGTLTLTSGDFLP